MENVFTGWVGGMRSGQMKNFILEHVDDSIAPIHSTTCPSPIAKREERPVTYLVFVSNYTHEFTKVGDRWYQTGFGWEPLLAVPGYRYDPDKTEGELKTAGGYDYGTPLSFHNI